MKICRGCGAVLQNENKQLPGYTPKEDSEYCQRCFRLIHYDDLTVSMKTGIDPDQVISRIAETDGLILWVTDLFDFEASMIPGLNRKLAGRDIIMAATKRDILPETLNEEKIARFVFSRLKEMGIRIKGLVTVSALQGTGLDEIREAVRMNAKGRPVIVMGRANSGKSTLLNNLAGKNILTASRYPGTTLDFNTLTIDGQEYIDTPGIEIEKSILMAVKESDLKEIIPSSELKPAVYQVNKDQSFAVGGLVRIDLTGCDHASCVFYVSERLRIHRSKVEGADQLWQKHYGEMLKPVPVKNAFRTFTVRKDMDKMDIAVDGLGWACVSGQMRSITVRVPEGVNVTFRKAML